MKRFVAKLHRILCCWQRTWPIIWFKRSSLQKSPSLVGELVALRVANHTLTELTDEQVQATCPQIGSDWREVFDLERAFRKGKTGNARARTNQGRIEYWRPSLTELSALPVSALRAPFLFLCLWSFLSLEARVWTTTSGAKSDGNFSKSWATGSD